MSATSRRLSAVLLRLDDDVDAFRARPAPSAMPACRHRRAGRRHRLRRSSRNAAGIDFPERAERTVDQPVIEPSGCYQRRNGQSRTASCRPHCRSDRQRQVGAGACALPSERRGDRQRRQRAALSRPADPSAAPGAGRARTRRASPLRRAATAPSPVRRPTGRRWRRHEIDDVHAAGRLPILVGGTGLYLRTLLDGIAPVPPIDPEICAERSAQSASRKIAELDGARSGRGGAAQAGRHDAHRPRARGRAVDRPDARRVAGAARRRDRRGRSTFGR